MAASASASGSGTSMVTFPIPSTTLSVELSEGIVTGFFGPEEEGSLVHLLHLIGDVDASLVDRIHHVFSCLKFEMINAFSYPSSLSEKLIREEKEAIACFTQQIDIGIERVKSRQRFLKVEALRQQTLEMERAAMPSSPVPHSLLMTRDS